MANQRALTASNIRYLLSMAKLNKGGGVRCIDIASDLGLSNPSVHNMMDTFVKLGLVSRNEHGVAFFTDEGYTTAEKYSRYYASVSDILKNSFPDMDNVQMAACLLLSEIPQGSLEELCGKNKSAGKN